MGEVGPFDPRLAMLARVDVLSRPDVQFVEKTDGPNGPLPDWVVDEKLEMCCGTDPARRRDSSAALFDAEL